MEEISSLDSFQTEGGDTATPRQDSTTPKLDEEQTESPGTLEKTDMPKSVESIEADETANTNSRNEVPIEDEEHASATNEDDFEQVSDGTFEVDDNSQETSTEPSQLVRDESANDKTNDADTETSVNEEEKSDRLEATTAADPVSEPQETLESEIVTVSNTPANLENKADEVDIFDQLHKGTSSDTDLVDAAPSSEQPTAMDVDEDEDKADDNVLADPGDVEMQSANNSPKYVNDGNDDGGNISNVEERKDVVDGDEVAHEVTEDATSEKNDEEAADEAADEGADGDDFDPNVSENIEDDAEHGDEPVENVQEPEESDVCLIPDDTETQMTEAEKEQAILARENAEKQELEEAAAEKAIAAEKAVAADHEKETSGTSDNRESSATDEAHVAADAQANKQAGAEADSSSKGGEESVAADGADPNEGDEQMSEEVVGTTNEAGSVSKTIISWVVSTVQTCKRCEEEKTCGFRVKKLDDSHGYEFYCDQSCCDALLKDNPGKYFIRRKKFLVEEVSNEESSISSASPKTTDREPSESEIDEPTNVVSNRTHSCLQCKEKKQCKYFIKQEQDTFYICNDDCFNLLNVEEPDKFKLKRHSIRVRNIGATTISSGSPAKKSNESRVVARTNAEAEAARQARIESFRRRCSECHEEVVIDEKHLLWETMDFCNELCLGKYQRTIGANCQTCNGEVSQTALGKYCVRFGFEVRQFCCAACLNVYKKGLKTCSCCQKDISSGSEGFLAPVGDKEQFKDFCSQACLRRYDGMCNPKKKLRNDICAVCNNEKTVRVEMILEEKEQYFCSNPCFSAFKFVSNIDADQCGMCCKYFERKSTDNFTIYDDSEPKVFCSRICINVFIIVNRHIVSCQWCKVKKYNFDMIYKRLEDREILTCSLTCLSMYGVSMKAFSRAVTKCDQCSNATTPQYHLTMSDASIRNFCTYQCVMQFQSQFSRVPLTLENELPSSSNNKTQQQQNSSHSVSKNGAPFPTGLPKRVKIKYNQTQPAKNTTTASNKKNSGPVVPVISTVTSLASGETEAMIGSVTVRRGRGRGRKVDSPPPLAPVTGFLRGRPRKYVDYSTRTPSPVSTLGSRRSSIAGGQTAHSTVGNDYAGVPQTETKIITLPPYPTTVRNVSTSCKPQAVSVGFQCTPETREIGVQTEKDYSNKVLIPVPVPIYVPQPMYMYSAPFPVPVPIPLPIPVPIFIPTTRNSAQGILKEIKKIQERMPTDPLEAELLMMAEMVAEEKHDSDSDSDNEIKPDPGIVQLQYNNSVQQDVEVAANNTYGEDVLQMALKMATGDDYDQQPTVDLESAMTANTISNPPPEMVGHDTMGHMNVHQLDQHMLDAQRVGRGRKRSVVATTPVTTPARNNRSPVKRQRLQELDSPIQQVAQHSPQQHQPTEKPDANMCLKYTFGVNAWKQWVMTKNADIEKSSMRRRTFKTDLLQMTADELNYSLCLFVKEVRKPNGTEYAPDTIYYLVLGIQQYLYVNGRIDNIFYDPYYERFTECLDEVARKFSVLYNDSQYIVTRVEEEHLWECKQLGAHSPHVLLSTLMFFNTKHFNLTTVEEHMQLSFSHIMKHWKRSAQNAKMPGTRNVLLRFYPPAASSEANPRKKKVYEQQENEENPLRCPVRLYEFYLSKCPESVKTRNDVFYLQPERSCVPDSPVWYSTQALSQDSLQRMLHRVKMVKEINIALLTS